MSEQTELDEFIAGMPRKDNYVDPKTVSLYPCPKCGKPVVMYHLDGETLGDVWSVDCTECLYEYLNIGKENTIRNYNLMAKLVDDKKKEKTHD